MKPTDADIQFVEKLKSQWMATVDALEDPLMIVDENYIIQKANLALANLRKTDIKELNQKICYKVFARRNTPCEGCQLQQAHKKRTSKRFRLTHDKKIFDVVSYPSDFGVVQVYRDMTHSERMREQLVQSEKLNALGLLAGGVAHEINNPLGGIMIFAQMLERELPQDSPFLDDVKEIIVAAKRCKVIVDQLLQYARSEKDSHLVQGNTKEVDLSVALKKAIDFAAVGKHKHLYTISESFDSGHKVHADENKLIQVFLNAIQNAMHAMPQGGAIQCQITEDAGSHIVTIQDFGCGIAEVDLPRIFEPFFTTKEPGQGTGLGLSISFSLMKEFGGRIEVESEVGEGTLMRFVFPIPSSG
jgi:two-component system, NtrC family, sensor kinase